MIGVTRWQKFSSRSVADGSGVAFDGPERDEEERGDGVMMKKNVALVAGVLRWVWLVVASRVLVRRGRVCLMVVSRRRLMQL